MGTPIPRVLLQEGLEILLGFGMPVEIGLEDAQVKSCLGVCRIVFQDLAQVMGGPLVIPFLQKDKGKLVVRIGKAGLQLNGL